MDKENKSGGEAREDAASGLDNKGARKPREDPFPPKLKWWQWVILGFSYIFLLLALLYLIEQLCLIRVFPGFEKNCSCLKEILCPCVCCTYIAFGVVLAVLIIERIIRHKLSVHKERREDQSVVDAMFVEADVVEPRLSEPEKRPKNYDTKEGQLQKEMIRLKNKVGNRGWTEYQVLSLDQMLVDFLKENELIARARLSLSRLEEYAKDSAYRYEWEQFYVWQNKIEGAIKKIEETSDDRLERDDAAEPLRASLQTLLEHVADYHAYWAEGSAIIRDIVACGVMAIPILLAMGLLPILHSAGGRILYIYNWGLLGIAGAITAALLSLRKSDFVEVGSTEGKRELWRAVLGAALGLVAGVLLYSMIAGGILSGSAFPTVNFFEQQESKNLALSIFWAIASGYSFEWVLDRVRNAMEGRS